MGKKLNYIMKHTFKVTLLLAMIFFVAQIVGLAITKEYISTEEYIDPETKAVVKKVISGDLPYNLERPEIEQSTSYIWITIAVIIGTLLLLLIIRFKKMSLWKLWFFFAVFFTIAIAFAPFVGQVIAAIISFIFALMKIYRPTAAFNNFTEIFIYGGLAAIFVPIINVFAAFALLFLISIYDIIAVRYTKHMVKLAKFQAKSKIFAGLLLPYGKGKGIAAEGKGIIQDKEKGRIAVLGGGDIGFPLLFAGAVMKELILTNPEPIGFLKTLIIPVFVTLALLYLLIKGEKDKFYPAMPYLAVGCVVGYFAVLLLF